MRMAVVVVMAVDGVASWLELVCDFSAVGRVHATRAFTSPLCEKQCWFPTFLRAFERVF